MRKFYVVLVALLFGLWFTNGAFCADGDELSTTSFRIDSYGEMYFQEANELIGTNDTITAAESGKIFIMTPGFSNIKMTLPAADEGLTYTFISQTTNTYDIDPNGSELLYYSTAAAGNSLRSAAAAGCTVTVHASSDSAWFVDSHGATLTVIPGG